MPSHGRLFWPTREELDEERRAVYDKIVGGPRSAGPATFQLTDAQGRLEGPFNAMLVNPSVGDALQELGAAIRYRTQLTAREREIAILTIAVLRRSDFEWYAHERVGRKAGLTEEELDALREDQAPPTLSAQEAIVRTVTARLLLDRDIPDDLYASALDQLGVDTLADLITLTGYYDLLSMMLRSWRTPLPHGEPSPSFVHTAPVDRPHR
ncbi:carboxymuconolactone decarboxylase family protein [Nocardia sp. R6R-6]|uniref:carboxymuconolactone decarboxylase family protein n=1 Tax=Nocardia sp. R6R-6 TaxID=3459303 RepID=UPI00403D82F5